MLANHPEHERIPEREGVTVRVIDAIARAVGTEPTDLHPPLYEAIDLEALERLCDSSSVTVRFEYDGHTVRIQPDDTVTVDGIEGSTR